MKVSVIIPVYNVSKYIERCLLSVLNQTWQDLEVILVDDCTPDDSMQIARRVAHNHLRGAAVRYLQHERNKGQSAARNTGIKNAEGDFLFFLDSDDYLPLDSLSKLFACMESKNYDFVLGNYEVTGQNRSFPGLNMETGALCSNTDILSSYAHDLWPRTVWNMLVKRSFVLVQNLFFEEGIVHEDDLWTFQLACCAESAYILNEVTYYYYIHFHSTTGNPSLWNLECRIRIIELMFDYISASSLLAGNRYVYMIFEEAKAKYFDRILYFTKDTTFQINGYKVFREKKYVSQTIALVRFHPGIKLALRNIHYYLPFRGGFLYFKFFVMLSYRFLIFTIKIKQGLNYISKLRSK